jgi:hypothetical protein
MYGSVYLAYSSSRLLLLASYQIRPWVPELYLEFVPVLEQTSQQLGNPVLMIFHWGKGMVEVE